METLNATPIKLSGFDILDADHSEITAAASAECINWDACSEQINQGQTECNKGIAIDRAYNGKVMLWLTFYTSKKGQEYPVITFHNFKDGTKGVLFNGHRWQKEQQGFDVPKAIINKPRPKKIDTNRQYKINRFVKSKNQFSALPVVTDTTGTYLEPKGFAIDDLPPSFEIKRGYDNRGGFIAYALRGKDGLTTGYQKIYDAKFTDNDGVTRDKDFTFLPNAKNGSYAILGQAIGNEINIAEGLATAISIYVATGKPVAICLDAGNMIHVATALKETFSIINLMADNDITDGRGNVGLYSAIKAAQAVGASVIYPEMGGKKCDFNDLHLSLGIEEVEKQIRFNHLDTSSLSF